MKDKLDIVIVDDHTMFVEGLIEILAKDERINIVGTAKNGEEALEIINVNPPDILISDIRMPGIDGNKLSKVLKKQYPDIKTLIISMHYDPLTISKLLNEGVMGYILKHTKKEELLKAIETIHSGQTYFSDEVKRVYMDSMVAHKKKDLSLQLTRREKEIVKLIAQELTTSEIADRLFISLNTVETHRKNILRKLDVRNSVGIVKKSMDLNLLDDDIDPSL